MPRTVVAFSALFLSGFASLVYQLCWVREASLVFGSTVYAVSTVLAVFFAGLAMGAWVGGRLAGRHPQPLYLFAVLEIVLGMVALLVPYGFELAGSALSAGYAWLAGHQVLALARALLLAAVLLVPALIMGVSLPLFVRWFAAGGVARPVGTLYAVNTLGAACGCALAGLLLVPVLGVQASVQLGAAVDIGIGIVLGLLRHPVLEPVAGRAARSAAPRRRVVGAVVFVAGATALGNEVLWTRFLALLVPTSVLTYTITIGVVLLGIVAGSALVAWRGDRLEQPLQVLGTLMAAQALAVLAVMHVGPAGWRPVGDGLLAYFTLLFVPAAISGAVLPLAVRIVSGSPEEASGDTGRLYALNTLGGIVGSLAVGFFTLPRLGLAASLWLTTAASLAAGVALWLSPSTVALRRRVLATVVAAAAWLAVPPLAGTRLPADFLAERDALVAFREGLGANVAVVRDRGLLQLEIDRWWQGSSERNHQVVAAHLPMLLHRDPRRVLVVGAGTGQTPSRFLMYDVRRLDCVDIEPAVFEVIREHFDAAWMDDPRVRLLRDDGRNHLAHTAERYDVISLEVGQIFRPGVASLYTSEFYRHARERLAPGGLVTQFVPLPFFTPADFRMVVRTFLDEFPTSVLWYNTAELLLIGWNADRIDVDPDRLRGLAGLAAVRADLGFSYWDGPSMSLHRPGVLLGGFLSGPRGLAALTAGAPSYGDDRPLLEYAASLFEPQRAAEILVVDLLREHLEPVDRVLGIALTAAERATVQSVRDANVADIVASARIRQAAPLQGARAYAAVREVLEQAIAANPANRIARRMLADVMVPLGDPDSAVQHYRLALEARPDDLLANRGLGYALHLRGEIDEAVASYGRALERWQDDADTHNNLGVALAQRGDHGDARRHFERALVLRPGFADAARNLARLAGATTPAAD